MARQFRAMPGAARRSNWGMAVHPSAQPGHTLRMFGRFQLIQLMGKSSRSMAWLATDPKTGETLVLAMPRNQAADAQALQRWQQQARRASRLDHPALAQVLELGQVGLWPYIAYDRGEALSLAERLGPQGMPVSELVPWAIQWLQGLAFAHDAGCVHHDLQAWMLLSGDAQKAHNARLIGLGTAFAPDETPDAVDLQAQRDAAANDVLAFGLVMHHALAGVPALEQPDVSLALQRLPPLGREIVRLPWTGVQTIPEALRAIINRATDRQERQRYRNARTLVRALEGWWRADGEQGGGPMALLLDRLRSVGVLPAMPGAARRAASLAAMEHERTAELAEVVLQDIALSFELLRLVNSAPGRGGAAGNSPVLTIRRSLAMLGLDSVRRAAQSLRSWPGPMNPAQADTLQALMAQVRLAGRIAQMLRPAGYDAEVVYLLAMLQNLGRMVVQYHFADEAQQIRRLMLPAPPDKTGESETPGLGEDSAAFAVLGVDIEALGVAVGRHWGLDDAVLAMIRRPSLSKPVHNGETDNDTLRLAAACANEVVDATTVPAARLAGALQRVAQRYSRALGLNLRDIELALHDAQEQATATPADSGALA